MRFKLRVVSVDEYSYNGRDHHPTRGDIGQVVVPLAMVSYYADPEEGSCEITVDGGLCANVGKGLDQENHEIMWTCVTAAGRTLELMSHEVEIVEVTR